MIEPCEADEADKIAERYACSNCWRPIMHVFESGQHWAICPVCRRDMRGYVTQKTVTYRREKSQIDRIDALRNIGHLFFKSKPTESELLSDLGF